jgi:hypothetical protein
MKLLRRILKSLLDTIKTSNKSKRRKASGGIAVTEETKQNKIMYPLETIKKLNSKPIVIRDNFNRDSSCCLSSSGAVIHSGVHRSTAFVSLPYALASLLWARELGQSALNGWIEATIDGAELSDCELTAISRQFPEWKITVIRERTNHSFTATRQDGKFQTRISALSLIDLGRRLPL